MKEKIFELTFFRALFASGILLRGTAYLLFRNTYMAMRDYCWVYRVSRLRVYRVISFRVIEKVVSSIYRTGSNAILESFLKSKFALKSTSKFKLSGKGANDIFRDILVLKKPYKDEKGVIILKYTQTFDAFSSFFRLDKLLDRYYIVLEPCWAGYCDPSILMFIAPGRKIFVQCFTDDDFNLISGFGPSLIPVRIGAADWIDSELFKPVPVREKIYDFIMVANWALHKRHDELFNALKKIKTRPIRVLLIGYNWGGRTTDDMRNLAKSVKNANIKIELKENLPQKEVCEYLSRSKVYLFLSTKEGDGKALVEALLADIPAIVYKRTVSGAINKINSHTGITTTYEDLSENLLFMLENYKKFSPRKWALSNTGSKIATGRLNEYMKEAARKSGEPFDTDIVEKTNSPNLAYGDQGRKEYFKDEYGFIMQNIRDRWEPAVMDGHPDGR